MKRKRERISFWMLGVRPDDLVGSIKDLLSPEDARRVLRSAAGKAMRRNRRDNAMRRRLYLSSSSATHGPL